MGDGLGGSKKAIGRLWGEATTSLYRNALFLMANSVVGQGLGFFFWFFAAPLYAPSDVGFAVTLFSTVSFVSTLALLGLGVALIRYLPESQDPAGLINASLTLVGLASLLLIGAFFAVVAVAGLGLSFILANPVYPISIVAGGLAAALGPILDNAAIGLRRSEVPALRTTALGLAKIPLAVVIAFTLSRSLGVGRLGVFLAFDISLVVSVVLEALWLLPWVLPGYAPRIRLDFSRLRPLMRFSSGNYVAASIGAAGSSLLPLLVLEALGPSGAENAAYFYVAIAVAGVLYVISSSAFTSFYAEASYRDANRPRDERRALLLSLGLLAPAIAVFWVFARLVLLLLGGASTTSYADNATEPLRILTLAAIPAVANNLLATRVRVRKQTLPLILGSVISTVVLLGVGSVLLATYGIVGLSVAVVLANAAQTPYYWFAARKPFGTEPLEPAGPTPIEP